MLYRLKSRSHFGRYKKKKSKDESKDSSSLTTKRRDSKPSRGRKVVIQKEKKYYRQAIDAKVYFRKDQDFFDNLGKYVLELCLKLSVKEIVDLNKLSCVLILAL